MLDRLEVDAPCARVKVVGSQTGPPAFHLTRLFCPLDLDSLSSASLLSLLPASSSMPRLIPGPLSSPFTTLLYLLVLLLALSLLAYPTLDASSSSFARLVAGDNDTDGSSLTAIERLDLQRTGGRDVRAEQVHFREGADLETVDLWSAGSPVATKGKSSGANRWKVCLSFQARASLMRQHRRPPSIGRATTPQAGCGV